MDFLKNIISMLSSSNIDISSLLSAFGQNNSSTPTNFSNILSLISSIFGQNTQNTSTKSYSEINYDEIYASVLF